MVVVYYINKQGGAHSSHLSVEASPFGTAPWLLFTGLRSTTPWWIFKADISLQNTSGSCKTQLSGRCFGGSSFHGSLYPCEQGQGILLQKGLQPRLSGWLVFHTVDRSPVVHIPHNSLTLSVEENQTRQGTSQLHSAELGLTVLVLCFCNCQPNLLSAFPQYANC